MSLIPASVLTTPYTEPSSVSGGTKLLRQRTGSRFRGSERDWLLWTIGLSGGGNGGGDGSDGGGGRPGGGGGNGGGGGSGGISGK